MEAGAHRLPLKHCKGQGDCSYKGFASAQVVTKDKSAGRVEKHLNVLSVTLRTTVVAHLKTDTWPSMNRTQSPPWQEWFQTLPMAG